MNALRAGLFQRGLVAAMWLPLALVFAVTWVTGQVMSTMPWPKPAQRSASHA